MANVAATFDWLIQPRQILPNLFPISDLIERILALKTFTMRQQRSLTLLLIALEGLLKKQPCPQRVFGRRGIEMVKRIFTKCQCPKNEDFQVDQRYCDRARRTCLSRDTLNSRDSFCQWRQPSDVES